MGTSSRKENCTCASGKNENGQETNVEDETNRLPDNDHEGEDQSDKLRGGPDRLHISRKAVSKYGMTTGCPACKEMEKRGPTRGRLGYNHNQKCRQRIFDEMTKDPEYRNLVDKHDGMKASASVDMIDNNRERYETKCAKRAMQDVIKETRTQGDNLGSLLNSMMLAELRDRMEVAEVYSPPSVVDVARDVGLRAGWSLDLTTIDEDGRPWDFNQVSMRNKAVRKLLTDKPRLLIGSPMCTAFSSFNNINYKKMDPNEVQQRLRYGRKHLEFCVKLYEIQWKEGR